MNQIKKKQKTKQWPHNKKTEEEKSGGGERRGGVYVLGLRPRSTVVTSQERPYSGEASSQC